MTPTALKTTPQQGRGAAWRLARHLQKQIAAGVYPPSTRLPSYRKLMEQYDLTTGTVSYAMSILAEQGYVQRRHGSGVYVQDTEAPSVAGPSQTGLFALVVPEIESGLYLSLQAGMESSAKEKRQQLITVTTGGNTNQQADVLLQLIDRGVSGIALVPPYETTHGYQLRHLNKVGIPLVLLHRGVPGVQTPLIEIPFEEAGRLVGAAIAKQGHRRVAAFLGIPSQSGELYLAGLRRGSQTIDLELADEHILWSESPLTTPDDYLHYGEMIESALLKMFDSPNRPTVVFASFDRLASLVYVAAMRIGVQVPDDLSIVCFGGRYRVGAILPRLATVTINQRETGRKAHELLTAMHAGDRPLDSNETFTMDLTFDPAETLGPPPDLTAATKTTHKKHS